MKLHRGDWLLSGQLPGVEVLQLIKATIKYIRWRRHFGNVDIGMKVEVGTENWCGFLNEHASVFSIYPLSSSLWRWGYHWLHWHSQAARFWSSCSKESDHSDATRFMIQQQRRGLKTVSIWRYTRQHGLSSCSNSMPSWFYRELPAQHLHYPWFWAAGWAFRPG